MRLLDAVVAVAVVIVLAAILTPTVRRMRETSRRAVCAANLKQIGRGVSAYAASNGGFGPVVVSRIGTKAPRTLLSRFGKYVNLGLLIETGATGDGDRFFCPSQTQFAYGSDLSLAPKSTVGGSYAYAVHAAVGESPRADAAPHLALATDDFVADLGMRVGAGKYAHKVGYNVLRTDGSVVWYADPEERIWKRTVRWDDETDAFTYRTVSQDLPKLLDESFGRALDVFRVWWAFSADRPDPFSTIPALP